MEHTEPSLLPPPLVISGKGFWIRLLSRLLDTVFGLLLGLAAGFCSGILLAIISTQRPLAPDWLERVRAFNIISLALSLVGYLLYFTITEGLYGASLGKLICGLRVVRQDGGSANFRSAFIRNLAFFVDGLFFGAVGYISMAKSDLRQRLGDVWGKTVVISARELPANSQRSVGIFLLALFLGAIAWGALLVAGLLLKALS